MTRSTTVEEDQTVPAAIRATLAEPLEAASGRTGVEPLAKEIEENEERRSIGSGTHVNDSDAVSEKGESGEVKNAKEAGQEAEEEGEGLKSHHANGLQDQTAYL